MALNDDSPEYTSDVPGFGSHVSSDQLRENFKALDHYDQGRVLSMYDIKAAEGLSGSDLDQYKHRLRFNKILLSIGNTRLNRSQNTLVLNSTNFPNFSWPTGSEQRLDLVYIDRNGDLGIVQGTSPHIDQIPERPNGVFPLAGLEVTADMNPSNTDPAAIRQTHIYDMRFSYIQSNIEHLMSKFGEDALLKIDANGNVVKQLQGDTGLHPSDYDGGGLDADTVDGLEASELQSGIGQWNSAQNNVDLSNDSPYINTGFSSLRADGEDSALWLNGQQLTFGVHYQVDTSTGEPYTALEVIDNDLLPLTTDDVAHVFKLGLVDNVTVSHSDTHIEGASDPIDAGDLTGSGGTSGQLLETDGTNADWTTKDAGELGGSSGNSGQVLKSNGNDAFWGDYTGTVGTANYFDGGSTIANNGGDGSTLNVNINQGSNGISNNAKAVLIDWRWNTESAAGADVRIKQGNHNNWTTLGTRDDASSDNDGPDGNLAMWYGFDSSGRIDAYISHAEFAEIQVLGEIT